MPSTKRRLVVDGLMMELMGSEKLRMTLSSSKTGNDRSERRAV